MSTSRERRLKAEAIAEAENHRRELGDPADLSVRRGLFEIRWIGGEGPTATRIPNELDETIKAVIVEVWGGPHAVTVLEARADSEAYARLAVRQDLATFDDDCLTRLVVACHRHAVRGEVGEGGFGRAVVLLHKRDPASLDEHTGHPSVDALSQRLRDDEDSDAENEPLQHAAALNDIREALKPEHAPDDWAPEDVASSVTNTLAEKRRQDALLDEVRAQLDRRAWPQGEGWKSEGVAVTVRRAIDGLAERDATIEQLRGELAALKAEPADSASAESLRPQERLDAIADTLAELVGQQGTAEELVALIVDREAPPTSAADGIPRLRKHVTDLRKLAQTAARGGWRGAQESNREVTGATAALERAIAVLRLHEGRTQRG